MYTKDDIAELLKRHLQEIFDVPAQKILPEARLYEDLGLDSIDAVDLVVKLKEITGTGIPPAEFKTVRTVGDVIEKVHAVLAR